MTGTPLPSLFFFNHSRQKKKKKVYLKDVCKYMLEKAA